MKRRSRPCYDREARLKMKCPFPPEEDWRDKIYPTPEAAEAYRRKLKYPPPPKPPPPIDVVEGEDTETDRLIMLFARVILGLGISAGILWVILRLL